MSAPFEFNAQVRAHSGKSNVRRMRHEELVPAIVYGADKKPQPITLLHKDIFHALENEAVFSHILKLTIDGEEERVVIKDVQRHAFKPRILHVDFLRIKMKEKITMNVPLHFIGEEKAPGVKDAGGSFNKQYTDLEIRCLPANLPEFIAVDVSKMQLDDVIHLSDIKLPEGVELAQLDLDKEHDHPVVSCYLLRTAQEDVAAEQQEAGLAEEAAAESEAEDNT